MWLIFTWSSPILVDSFCQLFIERIFIPIQHGKINILYPWNMNKVYFFIYIGLFCIQHQQFFCFLILFQQHALNHWAASCMFFGKRNLLYSDCLIQIFFMLLHIIYGIVWIISLAIQCLITNAMI